MSDASRHQSASPPTTVARIPLSLKIVALAFCLFGAALVADAIAQLLTAGTVSFAFSLLFALIPLLIARGLLRLRSAARKWAIFFSWLFIIGHLALIVLITLDPKSSLMLDDWRMLIFPAILAYVGWQCYVLHNRDVRRLFTAKSHDPTTSAGPTSAGWRMRFGLRKVFLVTFVFAIVFAWLSGNELLMYEPHAAGTSTVQSDGTRVSLAYGYRSHRFLNVPDKLDYVVIRSGMQSTGSGLVYALAHDSTNVLDVVLDVSTGQHSSGLVGTSMHKPDGTVVELPNEIQLYEFIDGKYRESGERVEKWQFDAWLMSNPAEYSIDSLLEYAKSHPTEEQ